MIRSRLRQLRFEKEERENTKLTYDVLTRDTGLAPSTLARLLKRGPIDRIDAQTLDALCRYFGVGVGEVLEFVPGEESTGAAAETLAAAAGEACREAVAA